VGLNSLVAGATGLVGSALLDVLAGHPSYASVLALTRRAPAPPDSGRVHWLRTDFQHSPSFSPPPDIVFLCLGTTRRKTPDSQAFRAVDHDLTLWCASEARKAGAATCVLVSAVGASQQSRFSYNRIKAETEADLAQLGFDSLLIFRPSLLLGPRQERRRAETLGKLAGRLISPCLRGPMARWHPTRADWLARCMARHGAHPLPGVHRLHYPFNTPES
jgi:uncharacterized protein YbjT (DUF2867 family)